MAEHTNGGIHIRQLNVRMAGSSTEAAHAVANGIGQGLAQSLPTGMQRRIGALNVRVHVPAGASGADISTAIVEAIMKSLQR
jgi:hypothetical protein